MRQIIPVTVFGMSLVVFLVVGITHAKNDGTSSTGTTAGERSDGGSAPEKTPGRQMNQPNATFEKQALDMTGGLAGKYDVVPVRRGELVDDKGGYLDHVVKSKKGETIGTITKLLKDGKTGKVEYAILELEGDKFQLPLQWNQLKQEGNRLTLNATKKELRPTANSTTAKDMSPDISHYMEEINKVRSHPKPEGRNLSAEDPSKPAPVGQMGESEVAGEGARSTPPGRAPGAEGDQPSRSR